MNQNVKPSAILPGQYEKCIGSASVRVRIKEDEFTLYSLNELFREANVGGETCLKIHQTQCLVKTLPEIDIFEPEDKQLLECGLSIGEGAECLLFMSRDDDSGRLYLFHTDGGYIEELNIGLDSLIKQIEE